MTEKENEIKHKMNELVDALYLHHCYCQQRSELRHIKTEAKNCYEKAKKLRLAIEEPTKK